jgi:hypothetical protein
MTFRWFNFMGEAGESNPYVPFQIDYMPSDQNVGPFKPLDPPVVPCSQGIDVSLSLLFLCPLVTNLTKILIL